MKILIVDDEEDLCLLLSGMLKREGHDVEYALTLENGMEKLGRGGKDFVFLDNNLPDGFGLNYIRKIQEISPDSKIIFMSAMGNLKLECESLGVTHFVEKPISFKRIAHLIN